jgi:hypothetical protein
MDDITGLRKSAKAMEESFFARENEKLLQKLRAEAEAEKRRESFRQTLQIDNETVLDRLVEMDLTPETIMAFTVIPLVEVAWADGTISSGERKAVLAAAAERGIEPGTTNYELLTNWLEHKPERQLFDVWKHYVRDLCAGLDADIAGAVRERVVDRTTAVAEAAGGFLGLNRISDEERAVLAEIDAAFD